MNLAISILPHRSRRRHQRRVGALRSPVLARRVRPRFERLEDRTVLATFLVINTADSGPGSLRQALLDSDVATGGTNTIDFDISGSGVQTISPLSSLPPITNPVLIDGESQPGYSGTPLIELSGTQVPTGDGLTITAPNVTVRGFDINNFSHGAGIHITGTGATGNWIYGNFLGTDPTGTQAETNDVGVEIDGGATRNLVGTNGDGVNDAAERNLLSANGVAGVWIWGQGTDGNAVAGNFIGTDVTGDVALGNASSYYADSEGDYLSANVVISDGASGNRIGTDGMGVDDAGERNLISGSESYGLEIEGSGTEGNIVAGNFIGTNVTGDVALGNTYGGVFLYGASSNWIGVNPDGGAAVDDEGNVISGNGNDGVGIDSSNGNVIAGNKIGTDATGTAALVNIYNGVEVDYAASNTIGGTTSGAGNLIAGNGPTGQYPGNGHGVLILGQGSNGNVVAGNTIGTDITGTAALGNAISGVGFLYGVANNTIGGLTTSAGVFHGFDFAPGSSSADLSLQSDISGPPPQQTNGSSTVVYHVDVETDCRLLAIVSPQGFTAQLTLLDSHGRVLVKSDGLSPSDPDSVIDQDLVSGSYSLVVESTGGAGAYTLTASMTLSSAPFQPVSAGAGYMWSMVESDFTGDGHLDMALADSYGVSVLLGNGDGTFQPANFNYVGDSGSQYIVAGDFTGDGRTDLAVAGTTYDFVNNTSVLVYQVSVLLGNGDGTFQPPVTYAVGAWPLGIVAGDFTGDGRIDLAVVGQVPNTNNEGEVSVLLGNGDGTFQPPVTYAVGLSLGGVLGGDPIVAGNFTGDGRTDLAVAGDDPSTGAGEVSVLLANGDGTLQSPVTYAAGDGPVAIVAGDFTGDGHLDLAVARLSSNNDVSVLLGNGDGTFQSPVTYVVPEPPEAIVAGDFTGDGRDDLAVSSYSQFNIVSVLLANSDGTFQPQVTYAVGYQPVAIVAGDFTGDGRTDLALADFDSNEVSVLLGNGDGTFRSTFTNAADGNPGSIATGDFTGNGRLDLAVVDDNPYGVQGAVSVFLGNGDGTFQPQVTDAVGSDPFSIVAGDFNGDGRLDLAVADADGIQILLGNGDGTFQPAKTIAAGISGLLVAGDFTGNGKLDLAVADDSSNEICILLGNGDGTFQPAKTVAAGIGGPLVAGDFNGDGRLDLAIADVDGIQILLGNGDGTFQPAKTVAAGIGGPLVAGDFTGDGRTDLAVAGTAYDYVTQTNVGEVSVLLGNGDGTFQPPVTYAVGQQLISIVAGDFTGDGHLDLAVTGPDFPVTGGDLGEVGVWVLLGNGDGAFQPPVSYAVGAPSSVPFPLAIVAGDFTGYGRDDLAVSNLGDNTVSVLLANSDGTFTDPGQFATTPHATPLVADVNGDGIDDVLVVDGAGDILYRQGIPGQPGSFLPPVTVNPGNPSRDITWLSKTNQGPVLASIDAQDDAISFYAYRDGRFVRLDGSLATGLLPAQIVAAQLDGNGLDDLVVRNAGDGALSVYLGSWSRSGLVGPSSTLAAPIFTGAFILPVGLGVSDVQVADPTGSGVLDLIVTNKLTGQVSILRNLGDGFFAAPVAYRAGTGLSAVDPGSTPEVTSLEATAGVAAGPLTPGGPPSLVTINPGSNTLDVLDGLGGGRFANPVTILTPAPIQVVRMADLTGNGIDDLAVLTAKGVSIYLGNGKGGFSSPVTYDAGVDPTGLTVADVLGNGQLDLLVGNAYGDVLILVGNGDGTFRPFEPVKADIALAVADLTGNGARDFVFANQSLNRVTVVYGSTSQSSTIPQVIGDQATGVLAPGAVLLHDMNGDGIPDLIVANSGGNNVLVYPGLGNGQFGPSINGTQGFPVGTNPTGLTVADLNGQPDLLVADTGSNDVSVLLGQGQGSSWTMIPGPRIQTDAGPVAMAVGDLLGSGQTDLAVANNGADNVQVFPSVGGGFFNDQPQATKTYAVGQAPSSLFLGNFGLGPGLATLNSGSNDGTLISGLGSANPVTQTFATGGISPTSGFAGDFTGDGFTDLVVGNNGDGHLALLLGGPGGLSLAQTLTSPAVPEPTGLSYAGVSDGTLSFYASTAGREAATAMAFALSPGASPPEALSGSALAAGTGDSAGSTLASATVGAFQQVAQLLGANGTTLSLIAPLFTVSIIPGEFAGVADVEGGVALLANVLPGTGPGSLGQPARIDRLGPPVEGADDPGPAPGPAAVAAPAPSSLPVWDRIATGLERAWEQVRAGVMERAGLAEDAKAGPVSPPDRAVSPAPAAAPSSDRRPSSHPPSGPAIATDAAIAELVAEGLSAPGRRDAGGPRGGWIAAGRGRLAVPIATAAVLITAAAVPRAIRRARGRRGSEGGPLR